MATYSAEGLTFTFDGTEVSQMKTFTLPEESAEVLKHAHLKSTKMDVKVSNIKDLGQFQFAYQFDRADAGQTAVRAAVGNTTKTAVLTFENGDTVTVTGKVSSVGGGSSDGIAIVEESATMEVESIVMAAAV